MLERSWLTPATSPYDGIWLMALLVFLVVLPVVLLCWSRYLYHKETMRMLELGGNGRAALEMRERWRVRWGLLTGVIVTVLGVAVFGRFVLLAKQVGGWFYLGPAGEVIRLGSLVVAAMGVIMLIAYGMWSARDLDSGPADETRVERERRRMRAGILAGTAIMLLGLTVLATAPLSGPAWFRSLGPQAGWFVGSIGAFVFVFGLVMVVVYGVWSQGRPLVGVPGDTEAERERWRVRGGMMFGTALILLGGTILALTPAASELIPGSLDPEHYFRVIGIFVASLGALKLLLYGIWSRGRPNTPGGREPGKGEVPEQRE